MPILKKVRHLKIKIYLVRKNTLSPFLICWHIKNGW